MKLKRKNLKNAEVKLKGERIANVDQKKKRSKKRPSHKEKSSLKDVSSIMIYMIYI